MREEVAVKFLLGPKNQEKYVSSCGDLDQKKTLEGEMATAGEKSLSLCRWKNGSWRKCVGEENVAELRSRKV